MFSYISARNLIGQFNGSSQMPQNATRGHNKAALFRLLNDLFENVSRILQLEKIGMPKIV